MKGDKYERGDVVDHERYGEVKIVGLSRRVEAVGRHSDDQVTYVKFTTEVDSQMAPEHKVHEETKTTFLRAVSEA